MMWSTETRAETSHRFADARAHRACDWSAYQQLGRAVERAWSEHDHDPSVFPNIALDCLRRFDLDDDFELDDALGWILEDPEPQEPAAFADTCLTLFRTDKFVVQINVWVHAGTTVHSHAFAGAFRVLRGASLHPTFSFVEHSRIAEGLLAGVVEPQPVENLRPGDTRAIHPGLDGLNHALFHHRRPSATLIVRTDFLPCEQPQYALFAPSLACAPIPRTQANRIDQVCGVLRAQFATNRAGFPRAFTRLVAAVELPSVVQIVSMFAPQIEAVDCFEDIAAAVRRRSAQLAELLPAVYREQLRLRRLDRCRTLTELDPQLNALVGLLQWERSRNEVEARLQRITGRGETGLSDALDRLFAASAMPLQLPADLRRPLLDAALRGDDQAQVVALLAELFEFSPDAAPKLAALYQRLVQLPELATVFPGRNHH